MPDLVHACTAEERHVLNMVRCWPEVPAIVIYGSDGTWSVSTASEHVAARAASQERPAAISG